MSGDPGHYPWAQLMPDGSWKEVPVIRSRRAWLVWKLYRVLRAPWELWRSLWNDSKR